MDFHALSRKDLQTLCKKNGIRANMTNAAMADALQALELVEGIEDIQLDTMTEAADVDQGSPKGESVRSKNVPRTCGRTSTRRKPIRENGSKEPEETPILSCARSRRGAAVKASNVRRRICEEEDEEKEDNVYLPTTLVEDNRSEVPKTPATRNGRNRAMGAGTSVRKSTESHTREEKENQNPVDGGLRTCSIRRSTRLSGKILQEAPPTIGRSRGRKEAVKIMALSVESEESEKESKEGSEKSNAHKEEERVASTEHVGKDLDQDPSAVAADAAPVIRKEDIAEEDIAGGNEATVLELPLPSESFDQGDQESIEEDLELAKLELESKEHEEKPIESSKTEDNASPIEVEAASNGNEAAVMASPPPPPMESCNLESKNGDMDPPAVLSAAENDDSELDPDKTTDTDWDLHRKNTIDGTPGEGRTESSIVENPTLVQEESHHEAEADEVSGHDSKNIEGGSSCTDADEILVDQGCEEGDAGYGTDDGVLPEGMVDRVPEDDAVDVPVQYAEDPVVESLALRLQENLTLKCNSDMEEESATDGGKSSSYIIGYPIPVSENCSPNADQDIGLMKASAEESDDDGDECNLYADAGLHLGGESATDFSDEVPPAEEGVESATNFSSDEVPPPKEGVKSATDFSFDEIPPLEDTAEGDDRSPSQEIRLKSIIVAAIENPVVEGSSSSLEQTLTDSSFGATDTLPTTDDNGADQSLSENPNHISDAFQIDSLCPSIDHVLIKTPASLRSTELIASDSGKMSGNKSNKSLKLSLSNKKTPTKSRIFEDADKENKNDGAGSAKREGKEFGSLSKVKKVIALIEDVNKGEDSRQKSLKKKSMRQLKRLVKEKINEINTKELLDKRSPLQALSENCLPRNEDN